MLVQEKLAELHWPIHGIEAATLVQTHFSLSVKQGRQWDHLRAITYEVLRCLQSFVHVQ